MTKIKTPNPREAATAFAAWLTTREGTLKVGGAHDAAPMADLVGRFCDRQGFADVRDYFPRMLNQYPAE